MGKERWTDLKEEKKWKMRNERKEGPPMRWVR